MSAAGSTSALTVTRSGAVRAALLAPDERDTWETLVAMNPASGFMQSWAWAEFKAREGYRVRPIGLYRQDRLAGGAILHAYPGAANGAGRGIVFAPEGPVLPWDEPALARDGLRLIVAAARQFAAETGALALRIEPHLVHPKPPVLREFVRAPMDLYPVETLRLDLTQDEPALLAAMKPKGRYNIRLAARHGVVVEHTDSLQALRRFYGLLCQSAARDDFFAEPRGFFINLLGALAPHGLARLYFAGHPDFADKHNPGDLAAALVVRCGPRVTYLYGGSADVGRNRMAAYALHWAIVRDARASGAQEYDFYGFEPHGLEDHAYAGFSRFKRQFGGTPVHFIGAQDYVFYDGLADALTDALTALNRTRNVERGTRNRGVGSEGGLKGAEDGE
jgi:lipid II:glycine glycyltransferase (peptidoglycan interpeptide bridge formation enzyme)